MELKNKKFRRRQWGAEKRTAPLPMLHNKPKASTLTFSRLAIILTVFFWIIYVFSVIIRQLIDGPQSYRFTMEAFSYSFVVSVLTFSSLMYLIARQGALTRFSKHIRTPRMLLDKYFSRVRPAITVLVPSYNEEYGVIRKTLLSAALQEYPHLRIVLLLDNKPNPTDPEELAKLETVRNLGTEISLLLSEPYQRFNRALGAFKRNSSGKRVTPAEIRILSSHYKWAANWLSNLADKEEMDDHVDIFFADQVLRALANDLGRVAEALEVSAKDGAQLSRVRMQELYRRLIWTFKGQFEVFERKKYASLSHEANKAMNLNAYIGLMGGTYKKVEVPSGIALMPTKKRHQENLVIPDSEYVLTLDADSILLRDYCLRLVYFLEQPVNAKVAVAQTPYSSFRGAFSRIERLAGATTDIQHILHQGMSQYGATFWVGANAVIRKRALGDIVETEFLGEYEVKRYIQDRTVIEDTESSVDLAVQGWKLMNYPERLSYSATPPDFGSLVIQRRRWANGGLLIIPKLMAAVRARKSRNELVTRAEIMLRVNYMASIAWATFGLIFLLAYPYDGRLLSPLVLLAAFPYFVAMASDLKYCGYKYSDVFRIYGFNLIMLPVNLAGVMKSVEQALTGKKIPFARTPKVKNRTPASLAFVIVPLLIVGFSVFTVLRNVEVQNWGNAAFAAFNAAAATWAIFAYIGIGNLLADIWLGLTDWLYVDAKQNSLSKNISEKSQVDWKTVLNQG